MWLARDKVNDRLYLYIYDKPRKGEKSGMFFNESNMMTVPSAIHIVEKDDTYKNITWENSPVKLMVNKSKIDDINNYL